MTREMFRKICILHTIAFCLSLCLCVGSGRAKNELLHLPAVLVTGQYKVKLKEEEKKILPPKQIADIQEIHMDLEKNSMALLSNLSDKDTKISATEKSRSCCLFGSPIEKLIPKTIMGEKGYYDLGLYKYQNKKYEEAMAIFVYLVNTYPDSPYIGMAYYWAGECALQQRDIGLATDFYQQVVNVSPRSQFADYSLYSLGWIYLKNGDNEKAIHYLKILLAIFKTSQLREQARYLLTEARYNQGRFKEAAAEYASYLEEFPKGPHAEDAL
ncbi:MAG: tetratricopeptide repeat protein, partial [bacterium]